MNINYRIGGAPGRQRIGSLRSAVVFWAAVILCLPEQTVLAGGELQFEVRETDGIRRFGYPVSGQLQLPPQYGSNDNFQLFTSDQIVPLQVTLPAAEPQNGQPELDVRKGGTAEAASTAAEKTSTVIVDFQAHLNPHESRIYTLKFGPELPAGPPPSRQITASPSESGMIINAGDAISYTVPHRLAGVLSSVKSKDTEWLRPHSPGLKISTKDGRGAFLGGDEMPVENLRVARQGAFACQLEFESRGTSGDLKDVRCHGTLTVPLAKSWIAVECRIEDPHDRVSSAGMELNFQLSDSEPLLVDFASGDPTYLTLQTGETAALESWPSSKPDSSSSNLPDHFDSVNPDSVQWLVRRGGPEGLMPFAEFSSPGHPAAGWVHLMDTRLCTAAAVAEFGHIWHDRWTVTAEGMLSFDRQFERNAVNSAKSPPKTFSIWYHFVYFPPHISAVTSPQSMMQAPAVRQLP